MPPTPSENHAITNHWIVTDGAAGNLRQAEALAEALQLQARPMRVQLRQPWSTFAPRWIRGLQHGLIGADAGRLQDAPPQLVIGCGRQAAAVTRWLRLRGQGRCKAIQILDPGIAPHHWDLVITPAHDNLRGARVLNPLGSLHPVDDRWLAEGRRCWPALGLTGSPRIGLLLGGPRRGVAIDIDYVQNLFRQIQLHLLGDRGSVWVLCSRRTPPELQALARRWTATHAGLCWTRPEDGANPYQGVLAWADRLVVTPDSVNMLSEACATGRPVHALLPVVPLPSRLAKFVEALQLRDLLRPLLDTRAAAMPWRETAEVAAEVRRRLRLPTN
ncbi:putative nucleoside-diphosphate-sugar epimerase [Frateuria aurantia DSM 6220]|uniref:Putative nucleoside-diphosphate-sugar epimerase n=1 Tax=Frateuria aurantia (strain ATCC 33424 / DSM 6220 / KCTC 2777 / LMG 1558 / NBRC 3245 / NCIMB 13370) TaxID=767434 RepID=H8L4D4_FRAAD|nr:putative nucleoside-diphosphate-sugar epimerase [Frateuria aurantia DSM 6220]